TLSNGTLTFSAGETTKNIVLAITNDTLSELDETIEITLSNPNNASLGANTAFTYTINDNDIPQLAFDSTSASGSEANTSVNIPVSLTGPQSASVTVNYSVTAGSASGSGTDYTLSNGTLTFNAGETTKNITLNINNDSLDEEDETIIITLSSPSNASLGTNTSYTYTINDDDDAPTIAFDSTNASGTESSTSVNIPISLSGNASAKTITVDYSITGTATGSGTDYTLSNGTLTFNPGISTQNISLTLVDDTITELNETIIITLSNPINTSIGTNAVYTYTINDNDPATVEFSLSTSSGLESLSPITIEVTLSSASGLTGSINYSVTGGTASGNGTDFTLNSGTLTFNPGETSKTISLSIQDDALDEVDETVQITLSNPNNLSLGSNSSYTYTILDNDNPPTVSFNLAASNSIDESATTRSINLQLSSASEKVITVVVTDSGGTATENTDYTSIASPLTINFPAGSTVQSVNIPIIADLEYEGNETILLSLSSAVNANLGTQTTHTFTIIDDEYYLVSAETMDCNHNGQIDHYKLKFSTSVNDSSFPGYISNSLGNSTSEWQISGYTNVALHHGTDLSTSCPTETDVLNDSVLYLSFSESGSFDTGSKPDLTSSINTGLSSLSNGTLSPVYTASLVESDKASPVIVAAGGNTFSNILQVTFSEAVWGNPNTPSCGAGGELTILDVIYTDTNSTGANSLSDIGSDSCATDKTVSFLANTTFSVADHNLDTLAAGLDLFDAANNSGYNIAVPLNIISGPILTNIQEFDTNHNGKIDQIKLTFSINMSDYSFADSDANRFTLNGIGMLKVDTASGGTGSISSPNNDPGTANDNIVTIFTDDSSVIGTSVKPIAFTLSAGKWMGNGIELQTISNLSSITEDKAPPVILSAVASDNTSSDPSVDSDDTLIITFSESTNQPVIDNSTIANFLSLSNSHSWGNINSANWNASGDTLTINFTGSGSSIAVGDYITIVNGISDTTSSANTSTNLISVSPISGSFYTPDTTIPTLVNATSINPTTVRVTFSEVMNASEATTVANYKIVSSPASGTCSAGTNFSSSTQTTDFDIVSISGSGTTYDITLSNTQTGGRSYIVIVNKTSVHDLQSTALSCPNNSDFIGNETIKVSSATCNSTSSIVLSFSKSVMSGIDATNSAECSSISECSKRYKLFGASSLGEITSATILNGTVCGGLAADSTKVCLIHELNQTGGIYSVVVANNIDGDGFDNSSWGSIRDLASTEDIQISPKDRTTFTGCGTIPMNFGDGPIISDPFGDGTDFGYLSSYANKVYIGPNKNGNGASRFNADGSNPQSLTFELDKDTNGSSTSSNTASIRDGGTAVPPYVSIGHTGCTSNNANLATGCGPDNNDGRGLFVSGIISGQEYLFITGGKSDGNNDYMYQTSDEDTGLNFTYIDASRSFDSDGIGGNKGTESIFVFQNKVYWMSPGDRLYRPYFVKLNDLTAESIHGTNNLMMKIKFMTGFGRQSSSAPNMADKVGGTISSFNDRLYMANSGSISNSSKRCGLNTSYDPGRCEQTGGIIRTNTSNPGACINADNCPDWTDITPSSLKFKQYFSIVLTKLADLIPADRPIPSFAEFNGKYYFIRNACQTSRWNWSCTNSSCNDDQACPAGQEIPQLWKCDPTISGSSNDCDPDDWSLIAENAGTGKTNFGDTNNKYISLLQTNGDYLYVGFDNHSTGAEVWRTNIADPSSENDFTQIGGDGFGVSTNQEIFSSISLKSGSTYFIYVSIGFDGNPVKVHRQQNTGPVAVIKKLSSSSLLAYLNLSPGTFKTLISFLSFCIILLGVLLYLRRRRKMLSTDDESI
ncbi:MAG: hypothetical protein H7A25_22530, partial [Leptospiraceae bacterium]|nr:hypothetical protein [Leptospiraceae bacterium]